MTSFRALVTGSRTWSDRQAILNALREHASQPGLVVVHGACPKGADALADELAREYGVQVERHPADWGAHGRAAGFVRNAKMVGLGADVCLAFIHNGSKGATMTADLAEKAGIPTWRFTVEDN
jgi:hypothetical protein